MKLENKVAIVTGGGKGIGAEICLRLAKEGAKIVIAEMDIESGKNTQKKMLDCIASFGLQEIDREGDVVCFKRM